MKIAVFTDFFFPQVNGVVTHIVETANLLAKRGHELILLVPKPSEPLPSVPLAKSIKVHYLSSIPNPIYEDFRLTSPLSLKVHSIVNGFKPDIIHFHSPLTVSSSGIFVSKLLAIPLIGTFHTFFMEPEYFKVVNLDRLGLDKSQFLNRAGWFYNNLFYNAADVIISPSHFAKKELLKHGIIKPIKVIKHGVFLDFHPAKKTQFNLPHKYFLYVGRVSREKNIDLLIEAFYKFSLQNSDVSLVIVGDGPAHQKLKNLIDEYKLTERVLFLGMITHEKLINSNIFSNALCFITASTSETQGISIIEAINFGLPLICANARGMNELINGNGILYQPDNVRQLTKAMLNISNSPKLVVQYKKGSLKMARQHSIQNTVVKMETLYKSLLKK